MALQLPINYTIDVHTHPIPKFFRDALIDSGYPVRGGELWVDGFVTPAFDIESYIQNRKDYHYDYSVMSITAPGVSFLNGNPRAKTLARQLNDQMAEWTATYPDMLGALACLPMPDIQSSLDEIKVSTTHSQTRFPQSLVLKQKRVSSIASTTSTLKVSACTQTTTATIWVTQCLTGSSQSWIAETPRFLSTPRLRCRKTNYPTSRRRQSNTHLTPPGPSQISCSAGLARNFPISS
jgi:Amidohydrolase